MSEESLRGSDAISVQELADMRSTGGEHLVLDVREARELDICQLEGVLHIPMAEIPARVNDLPTNQPMVVLCHHGARSQMVVDFLRDAGFDNAVNLDGGIEAWACEIDRRLRHIAVRRARRASAPRRRVFSRLRYLASAPREDATPLRRFG